MQHPRSTTRVTREFRDRSAAKAMNREYLLEVSSIEGATPKILVAEKFETAPKMFDLIQSVSRTVPISRRNSLVRIILIR